MIVFLVGKSLYKNVLSIQHSTWIVESTFQEFFFLCAIVFFNLPNTHPIPSSKKYGSLLMRLELKQSNKAKTKTKEYPVFKIPVDHKNLYICFEDSLKMWTKIYLNRWIPLCTVQLKYSVLNGSRYVVSVFVPKNTTWKQTLKMMCFYFELNSAKLPLSLFLRSFSHYTRET